MANIATEISSGARSGIQMFRPLGQAHGTLLTLTSRGLGAQTQFISLLYTQDRVRTPCLGERGESQMPRQQLALPLVRAVPQIHATRHSNSFCNTYLLRASWSLY